MATEERLEQYETLEVRVSSRQNALRKLAELKNVEKRLLKEGKLQRVQVLNGYALTTFPKRFTTDNF